MNLITKKVESIGRTLYVDLGQPIDPNLVEALCYEVLDEKISSMIHNKNTEDLYPSGEQQQQPPGRSSNGTAPPPIPSPRRSLEFLEQQKDRPVEIQVPTPVVTPTQSRPSSPLPATEHKPAPVEKAQQTEQIIQFVRYSDDESILDVTIEEDNQEPVVQHVDNDTNSIQVPKTPEITPAPSPVPPETPEVSFVASEPAPPETKHFT
jgi:hypothetical protein